MPSTVVLSTWPLNRVDSGGKRRIDALMNALGRHTILVQPGLHHPKYTTVPYSLDLGRRKLGINWGIFNFSLPQNRRFARNLIRNQSPACVVLTSIWGEPVVRGLNEVPVVLDAHDVNATAIAERFGRIHPFTKLVHAQEARTVKCVDHLFACSEQDREQFMESYGIPASKVTVVPNGVDTNSPPPDSSVLSKDAFWQSNVKQQTPLFFMGKLDYQPNIRSLAFLNDTLLPELEQRSPGKYRIIVSGGPVPAATFRPGIAFSGTIDDRRLQAYLHGSSICLAPVFTGSGTRLKVLEYLSAARPVVATAKAAEGIPCESGKHLVIADPESFADEIEKLARDPAKSDSMAQAGRNLVREKFDWTSAVQPKWRSVLDQWCDFSPTSPWPKERSEQG